MCRPKPGPRCASELRTRLEKADAAYGKAKEAMSKLYLTPLEEKQKMGYTGEDDPKLVKKYDELADKAEQAKKYCDKAYLEYLETPTGRKELEHYLHDIYAEPLPWESTTSLTKDRMRALLDAAAANRAEKLALYRAAINPGKPTTGYHITDETDDQARDAVLNNVAKHNVYFGKLTETPTDEERRELMRKTQNRINTLVECFTEETEEIAIDNINVSKFSDRYEKQGFEFLSSGAYRAAFLDEETGQVIKLPLDYFTDEPETIDIYDRITKNEQGAYAIMDLGELHKHDMEYVETTFYNSTNTETPVPVVVQPYLSSIDFHPDQRMEEEGGDLWDQEISGNIERIKGLNDGHFGNYFINNNTGKIVLFDCLVTSDSWSK